MGGSGARGRAVSRSPRPTRGCWRRWMRRKPPERRPVVRGAGRPASRGCGRGHPRSAPGRRRAHLQRQGPRRHRAGCHRAMCAVHRPIGASLVTGLGSRDAPACGSSGALRVRRLSLAGETLLQRLNGQHSDEMVTRHGAWGGAAVSMLSPPSIIATAAVGGVSGHLWRGMSRADIKEFRGAHRRRAGGPGHRR
jgi:hypothetical protein